MAYSNKNVIVGAAALYVSKKDSEDSAWVTGTGVNRQEGPKLPDFASLASGKSAVDAFESTPGSTDWYGVGYTTDGIEVSYEPDYGEVTVDQLLDSAKVFKQGMRVSVNTTLAEATLENLIISWGLKTVSGSVSTLAISGGALHDDPIERSLAFVGKAPRASDGKRQERVYHLRRALQVESSAHSLSRSDATTIPVSFRCLPSDSVPSSSGDYGVIIQRTIT